MVLNEIKIPNSNTYKRWFIRSYQDRESYEATHYGKTNNFTYSPQKRNPSPKVDTPIR